ncbi:hypothetical protein DYB34_009085 [Aphanomyces astaci]|uniref:Uncharacterized protein n=1 Tax=Aphanomyces astaci TaxID=112090 RepID=A0A397FC25_APHAT|nr:hypothetical protein DYB34_009085 [Aphanomyces astaci]RHZ26020.1 hypothetical protein DYB31_009128 [Aphanomyces astaci]
MGPHQPIEEAQTPVLTGNKAGHDPKVAHILNSMHYDMAPYAIWAIRVGSSKISRGDKHSYRMTAALSVRGNGEKLSILFILRGIPGGLIEQGKFDDFPIGTFMQFKKRRGWMHACGLFT